MMGEYWVVLSFNSQGVGHATVVGPTRNKPKGYILDNAFATHAEAQQDANKWNALPPAARHMATKPQDFSQAGGVNPLSGIAAVGDFFQRLTQTNTWVRVGEFMAGAMLLYIGLKAVTSGTAVGNAVSGAVSTSKKAIGLAAAVTPK